ncbi:MAG: RNase adapter RapZ [Microbacteriaceae bacterium]
MPEQEHQFFVVTGMSGAGRSTVANALEDMGWYVVDNLPPQMLGPISDLFTLTKNANGRLAVVIDVRGGELFGEFITHIEALRSREISLRMLFLEASDATLVKRFESVRRPHPLQGDGTILDGITAERTLLAEVRGQADVVIDTSDFNIHQLSTKISDEFRSENTAKLSVTIESFGFKHGVPVDADHVADMRFLPNPFWNEVLRPFNGNDQPVADYVLSQPQIEEFIDHYVAGLKIVFDGYMRENKRYVTVAIGCTGGKHRSVAVSRRVAELLSGIEGVAIHLKHRDIGKE